MPSNETGVARRNGESVCERLAAGIVNGNFDLSGEVGIDV
jgi:hypothetical protein